MPRAAYRRDDRIILKEIPSMGLSPGQVRISVDACGICGTDLLVSPDNTDKEIPMTGHEVAGRIMELGPGVAGFDIGDRVVLDSATPCGRCENCRNARQELCTNIQSFFYLGSFGFCEEMVAPAGCAIPYKGLDPAVACLQEPLGVAIDMVRLAEIRIDSNVLVLGGGPIGLMALALARQAGARRVFLCQPARRTARCELARAIGADEVIDPRVSPVREVDFGCKIDRVLVTSSPRTLPDAFEVASKGAVISFIGIEHGEGANCTFDANAFHFKKLQLRASFASPALFGPEALRCLREGIVDGNAFISHRFPLDRIADAVAAAKGPDAIKVIVIPTREENTER